MPSWVSNFGNIVEVRDTRPPITMPILTPQGITIREEPMPIILTLPDPPPDPLIDPEAKPEGTLSVRVNRHLLYFWIQFEQQRGESYLMVSKSVARKKWAKWPKYKVATFTANGEFIRNSGLPEGWGFQLTESHRIREIR